MTKSDELKILDRTIASLGPDSYLGPWLADARVQITADIGNDFPISVDFPLQANAKGIDIIARATQEGAELTQHAEEKSIEILEKARSNADAIRHHAARSCYETARTVERCADALTR